MGGQRPAEWPLGVRGRACEQPTRLLSRVLGHAGHHGRPVGRHSSWGSRVDHPSTCPARGARGLPPRAHAHMRRVKPPQPSQMGTQRSAVRHGCPIGERQAANDPHGACTGAGGVRGARGVPENPALAPASEKWAPRAKSRLSTRMDVFIAASNAIRRRTGFHPSGYHLHHRLPAVGATAWRSGSR